VFVSILASIVQNVVVATMLVTLATDLLLRAFVVFGITLRFLVINIFVDVSREQQTTPFF